MKRSEEESFCQAQRRAQTLKLGHFDRDVIDSIEVEEVPVDSLSPERQVESLQVVPSVGKDTENGELVVRSSPKDLLNRSYSRRKQAVIEINVNRLEMQAKQSECGQQLGKSKLFGTGEPKRETNPKQIETVLQQNILNLAEIPAVSPTQKTRINHDCFPPKVVKRADSSFSHERFFSPAASTLESRKRRKLSKAKCRPKLNKVPSSEGEEKHIAVNRNSTVPSTTKHSLNQHPLVEPIAIPAVSTITVRK